VLPDPHPLETLVQDKSGQEEGAATVAPNSGQWQPTLFSCTPPLCPAASPFYWPYKNVRFLFI